MRLPYPFLYFFLFPGIAFGLSIQLPLPHTVHAANTNILVTWSDVDAGLTTVSILLARGEAMSIVSTLGENITASQTSASLKIPPETPSGSDYYIVMQGNNNIQTSKGPFTVILGPKISESSPPSSGSSSSASASVTASSLSLSSLSNKPSSSASSSSSSNNTTPPPNNEDTNRDEQNTDSNGNSDKSNGLTSGQVAGVVVGVIGALAVTGIAAMFIIMARRKRGLNNKRMHSDSAKYYDDTSSYVIDNQQYSRFGPPPPQATSVPTRSVTLDKPHLLERTY
ncbi:hypothetical protein BX666DRAFT_1947535 [Dichotomocladium elegans]|nr:hypothetical protein BX666DRAFT_1947535 [Dichotomocladium elegans]